MNTVVKVNGFEIEISGGLNDAFVKVTNSNGDVIADLEFDQDMPALEKKDVEHVYIKNTTKDDNMDEWQQSYRKIQDKVKHLDLVCYSAYGNDDRGIPNDNLADIAISGESKIMWDSAWVDHKGKKFKPTTVVNPTWLDLTGIANDAIRRTGDVNHQFFEGIRWDKEKLGYQLMMGS